MMMLTSMMLVSTVGCLVLGLGVGLWHRRRTRPTRGRLAWLPDLPALPEVPAEAIPVQRTASPPVATRPKAVPRAG